MEKAKVSIVVVALNEKEREGSAGKSALRAHHILVTMFDILTSYLILLNQLYQPGNLIMDTGSKSNDQPMMPMMPMHHISPFSFYPMSHQHHQPAPMVHVQPVYLEDHSAMHMHHHQPEHHQQHEYHNEEPHHYQHHEIEHHEVHHEPEHHEMSHHMPEHHHEEMGQHHEPVEHHYEHMGHQEEAHHSGYESHPMIAAMMMHGSGLQPSYEQLATMQALQQPPIVVQHQLDAQRAFERQNLLQQEKQLGQVKDTGSPPVDSKEVASGQASTKQTSIADYTANNPLVAMIRPLFKRNNTAANKNKKP